MSEGAREDGSLTFYLFDFDDNIMFLETKVALRNNLTGQEKLVGTHEFAAIRQMLGAPGKWLDYEIYDDTYRFFRDKDAAAKAKDPTEYFVQDIKEAITHSEPSVWKAPSWDMFVHACNHQRPLSIITARGHSGETICAGVRALVEAGHLKLEPNYLSIYAVSNADSKADIIEKIPTNEEREKLQALKDPTSALKRYAIHQTVEAGLAKYAAEPPHRFGMSDDDPGNIDLIVKAMAECKAKHVDKRFFAINTHQGRHAKLEVFPIDFPVTKARREVDDYIA